MRRKVLLCPVPSGGGGGRGRSWLMETLLVVPHNLPNHGQPPTFLGMRKRLIRWASRTGGVEQVVVQHMQPCIVETRHYKAIVCSTAALPRLFGVRPLMAQMLWKESGHFPRVRGGPGPWGGITWK